MVSGRDWPTRVDDVHAAHASAGIVEHPLLVEINVARVHAVQLRDDEVHDGLGIVAMLGNGAFREVVEMVLVEDEELVDVAVEEVEERQQDAADDQSKGKHLDCVEVVGGLDSGRWREGVVRSACSASE